MSTRAFPDTSSAALRKLVRDEDDEGTLACDVVDAIREPLLVLDKDLRVVTANRAFHLTFKTRPQDVFGLSIYALCDGVWNTPPLRLLLSKAAAQPGVSEACEVEQDFAGIGRRRMMLDARTVLRAEKSTSAILLAIEDITERRAKERELNEVLQQKEVLLKDMQHRVGNSLQIIASILLIKARTAPSDETRLHLQAAHQRVMSVAAVQQQLQSSENGGVVELVPYLSRLCQTLAASMIGDGRSISLEAEIEGGTASSSQAISIGLIVTELVINAFKHAFPDERSGGRVTVAYEPAEPNWRLSVSDNGVGGLGSHSEKPKPGLGTTIVEALAKQLGARVDVATGPHGTTVSITSSRARVADRSTNHHLIAEPIACHHAAAVARWDDEGGAPPPAHSAGINGQRVNGVAGG